MALALEEVHAARLEEHAIELAEHFSHSSDPSSLAKAVEYGEMAAQRATAVFAYGEGVSRLERCLQVQEVQDPGDSGKRCDLLLALGESLELAGEPRRLLDVVAPEALALAEELGDSIRASRACQLAILGVVQFYGAAPAWATAEGQQWAERADRYAQPETVGRAWADSALGAVMYGTGHPDQGSALLNRAMDLVRRLDDPDTFWWVAASWLYFVTAPQHGEEALRLAEELAARPRAGVRTETLYITLHFIAFTFLMWGKRGRAEEVWRELDELAQRTGQGAALLLSMLNNATLATLEGRLDDAVATGQRVGTRGDEMGLSGYARRFSSFSSVRPLLYLGKADDALQLSIAPQVSALCLAHLGRLEDVAALLEELVLARPGIGSVEDESDTGQDIVLLEAATLLGHREAVELLLRRFAVTKMRTTGTRYISCIARHLGAAAALLGRPDEARGYYQTALEVCREMPFRPEEALTHLQLAELLLDPSTSPALSGAEGSGQATDQERSEALEHLDTALDEFREMSMQPSLERAVALKERAEAGPVRAPAYPDGLTQREVEVLRLIAGGKTNLDIAEELVIAEGTARRHVANIYEKIGATNRVEAAAYAIQKELMAAEC